MVSWWGILCSDPMMLWYWLFVVQGYPEDWILQGLVSTRARTSESK